VNQKHRADAVRAVDFGKLPLTRKSQFTILSVRHCELVE
jgi:hypothetical protein